MPTPKHVYTSKVSSIGYIYLRCFQLSTCGNEKALAPVIRSLGCYFSYYFLCLLLLSLFFFSHIHLGCHLKQLGSNWWQYSFQVSIWCLFFSYENQKNINACACYSCPTSLIWKQMNYCLFWVGQVTVHPTGSWTSYKYTCNTTCLCFTTLNRRFCEDKCQLILLHWNTLLQSTWRGHITSWIGLQRKLSMLLFACRYIFSSYRRPVAEFLLKFLM